MIYIGLTIILILVAVLVVVIVKLMNVEKNNSITINLISTGMVILTSGILGVYDFILNLVYSYNGWEDKIIQAELKPLSTIIGFVLILSVILNGSLKMFFIARRTGRILYRIDFGIIV